MIPISSKFLYKLMKLMCVGLYINTSQSMEKSNHFLYHTLA